MFSFKATVSILNWMKYRIDLYTDAEAYFDEESLFPLHGCAPVSDTICMSVLMNDCFKFRRALERMFGDMISCGLVHKVDRTELRELNMCYVYTLKSLESAIDTKLVVKVREVKGTLKCLDGVSVACRYPADYLKQILSRMLLTKDESVIPSALTDAHIVLASMPISRNEALLCFTPDFVKALKALNTTDSRLDTIGDFLDIPPADKGSSVWSPKTMSWVTFEE